MSSKSNRQDIPPCQDEGSRVADSIKASPFYLGTLHDTDTAAHARAPDLAHEAQVVRLLLQQVHQITDQFFHGATCDSLKKAISLGFNGRQFAHYLLLTSSCEEEAVPDAAHGHGAHLGTPMWEAMREFEQEIPAHVRLTDGIRFVCRLRDLFAQWSRHALFVSRGTGVHDLLQQVFTQKGAHRKADERLMAFTLDILAALAEVHK